MTTWRQGLKRLITRCLPAERWLVRGLRTQRVDGPAISLTFDDGPHPEITPQVLDRLQTFGWKGTFFVIGSRAEQHPDLIRRIVDEGHELGNHSWTHSEPQETSAATFREEIAATNQLLERLAGKPVSLVRPPKGELTCRKLLSLWRARHTVCLWNVDPKDYRVGCETELVRWAARYEAQPGDIVLLHDVHPQVLTILDTLQEHRRLVGKETVTLSAWLRTSHRSGEAGHSRDRRHSQSEGMPCP